MQKIASVIAVRWVVLRAVTIFFFSTGSMQVHWEPSAVSQRRHRLGQVRHTLHRPVGIDVPLEIVCLPCVLAPVCQQVRLCWVPFLLDPESYIYWPYSICLIFYTTETLAILKGILFEQLGRLWNTFYGDELQRWCPVETGKPEILVTDWYPVNMESICLGFYRARCSRSFDCNPWLASLPGALWWIHLLVWKAVPQHRVENCWGMYRPYL